VLHSFSAVIGFFETLVANLFKNQRKHSTKRGNSVLQVARTEPRLTCDAARGQRGADEAAQQGSSRQSSLPTKHTLLEQTFRV
jgi:hypothetical protein